MLMEDKEYRKEKEIGERNKPGTRKREDKQEDRRLQKKDKKRRI